MQWRGLRADHSIRKSSMEKKDSRILEIAPREIVAAKTFYHKTCYKGYTRTGASHNGVVNRLKMSMFISNQRLTVRCISIASDRMSLKTRKSSDCMKWLSNVFGCWRHLVFTKKHIRRNLKAEFGDVFLCWNLIEATRVFIWKNRTILANIQSVVLGVAIAIVELPICISAAVRSIHLFNFHPG